MDIATVIGLVGGSALLVCAVILGGSAFVFINIAGLLIVLGGSIATTFIKFSMNDVINTLKVVLKAFMFKTEPPQKIIDAMLNYAKIAKSDGLIALEKEKTPDEFSGKALRYLSDGIDEALIEDMLKKDISQTVNRHTVGQNIFKGIGSAAPAFGMIGTLVGLVQMLASMDDPSKIGPAMAIALLTTLYGAVIANLVCLPIAEKLEYRSTQEKENKSIILEAAIGITRGTPPMVLSESLSLFLDPKTREQASAEKNKKKKQNER